MGFSRFLIGLIRLHAATMVVVALVLSGAATLAQETSIGEVSLKVVQAEGIGANADPAKARDDAITDAQRRAVEQAVGLYLKSDSLVKNFVLIEDSIYTHTQGYIHSYEVTSDESQGEERRVKIRAQVRTGKIEEDLENIWERLQVTGSPRLLVAIEQPQPSDVPNLVQSIITGELVEYGFKVLEPSPARAMAWRLPLQIIYSNDNKRMGQALAMLSADADLIIAGKANYRLLGRPEPELDIYSCEGSLEARVFRTDTGQIVTAKRGASNGPTAAFAESQAIEASLRAAAQDWIKQNLGKIVKEAVDPTQDYSLAVSQCRYADVEAITGKLRELRFVRRVQLRSFNDGNSELEVVFLGTAQRLAEEIKNFTGPKLEVKQITKNRIIAKIKF